MIRVIAFMIVTVFYLLMLDARVLVRRVFWAKSVESFLNVKAVEWAQGIVKLIGFFLGVRIRDQSTRAIRSGLPPRFIAITNHQSLLDILLVYFLFPDNLMRFVAKESLGSGFPGVSQTLRFGRHALIQRKGNARQLVGLMARYARRCAQKGYCPAIFPEGTRSRTGEMGAFQAAGLRMILEQGRVPIVVAALDGGYRFASMKGFFSDGSKILHMKILGVLDAPMNKDQTNERLEDARSMISEQLKIWRAPTHATIQTAH